MPRNLTTEAMNLALALAARAFPEPTLAHVSFLLSGRAHLWPGYQRLSEREKNQYAALLRHRGPKLESEVAAQHAIFDEFAKDSDNPLAFGPVQELDEETILAGRKKPGEVRYAARTALDLDEQITSSITYLEEHRRRGGKWATREHAENDLLTLRSPDGTRTYSIPTTDLPTPPTGQTELRAAPSAPQVTLQVDALQALADRLTQSGDPAFAHYGPVARAFLAGLRQPDRDDVAPSELTVEAGPTQLLIAPTGSGKNVVADLVLLELARQGRTGTLVVTNVDGVLKATRRLERAANVLGLDIEVAALFSQSRVHREAGAALERDPDLEGEGAWALQRLAYPCRLGAYQDASDPTPTKPGREPCRKLQARAGGREHKVWCPFHDTCPKFSEYRRANTAQVLVINHHALLSGSMPIVLDEDSPRMLAFVLQRSELLLVDEIDALQQAAIQNGAGEVILKSFGVDSDLQQARDDLDRGVGRGLIRGDRIRPLDGILILGTETLDLVKSEIVQWKHITKRGGMLWEGALDGPIGKALYPDGPDRDQAPALIDELYDPNSQPERHARIAEALKPFTDVKLGKSDSLATEIAALRLAVKQDLDHLGPEQRRELSDQLVVRGNLALISTYVDLARDRLAEVAAIGSEAAANAREGLGRFNAWSVSPFGALGRTLAGFNLAHDNTALKTSTMNGDPHGDIIHLGELAARAQAGTARAVLGLSASAYFPGSAANDVLAPIGYYLPDQPDRVTIHPVPLDAERISGTLGQRRLDHVRDTAQQLWRDRLAARLTDLEQRDPDRARALIVTGNYQEAEAAAHAIAALLNGDGDHAVRYLTNQENPTDPKALKREQIESFPDLPGAKILIAPRIVIARGFNIMAGQKSAISSIYMLVRPIPPTADLNRALAYVSYNIRLQHRRATHTPNDVVEARRTELKNAGGLFRQFRRANPAFTMLPDAIQHQLLADVFVDLLQLVGRARRGDTSVDVYFVDAAFHDAGESRWEILAQRTLDTWRQQGELDLMRKVHRSLIEGLEAYAAQAPNLTPEEA